MKNNMLAKIFACFIACALACALSSDGSYTPSLAGVSSHNTLAKRLGINCRGSAMCGGCRQLSSLSAAIASIPDNKTFKDGEQIACTICSIDPRHRWDGICVFLQYMGDKTLDAGTVKSKLSALQVHGCQGFGSVPIYAGNNVKDGELTVNYVRKGCGARVCDSAAFVDEPFEDLLLTQEIEPTQDSDSSHTAHPVPSSNVVSPRDPLEKRLGINCRGSALCWGCNDLGWISDQIATIPDDKTFTEGQQIACSVCTFSDIGDPKNGLCAFLQYTGDMEITAKTIKGKMSDLLGHKCKGCGSVPILEGNNIKTGELTVNYVKKGCGEGVCPDNAFIEGRIEDLQPAQASDPSGSLDAVSPRDTPAQSSQAPQLSRVPLLARAPRRVRRNLTGISSREVLDTLLGINCRGSILCNGCNDLDRIKDYIDSIEDDNKEYEEGQQIACFICEWFLDWNDGICAFMQKMGGKTVTVKTLRKKIQDLVDHGCKGCGSVPIYEGNNVNDGELTVNYVHRTCMEDSGVCPDREYRGT